MSETIDSVGDGLSHAPSADGSDATAPLNLPHLAAECPKCFTELQRDRDWWLARPAGARLVGLVVAREGMPSVTEQRDELTRFGVPIRKRPSPMPEIFFSKIKSSVRITMPSREFSTGTMPKFPGLA